MAVATIEGRISGAILRLERLSLRIDQKAFAKVLGMSRQRLDELEKRERLTDEFIDRYHAGLRLVMTIAPDSSDTGEG